MLVKCRNGRLLNAQVLVGDSESFNSVPTLAVCGKPVSPRLASRRGYQYICPTREELYSLFAGGYSISQTS